MLRDILTLGDKIDIKPVDKNGRPRYNSRIFASQFIDFVDSDVIYISAPIVYGKPLILNVGDYYNLCFYSEKGLYQCNCVVLSNHKENNLYVIVVRIITNLEKFQRRQFFRLECIHEMEYRIITEEEEVIEKIYRSDDFKTNEEREECKKLLNAFEQNWKIAAITDLSGGGARFNSSSHLNKGDKIRIKLDIQINNNAKRMILGAKVISSIQNFNKNSFYEQRVEFTDITQKEREDLIKYIFEQERKRRSK